MTYQPGQRVRVATRPHEGHHRTPGYVKGKTGTVERAYGQDGLPEQQLYLVGFAQRDVWPDYAGQSRDRIYLDLFEHWLEDAE